MEGGDVSLLIRWFIGSCFGTLLIGVTSPLFVRSFLANEDSRGIVTYASGGHYRWRSEGYASTAIGPHGMPGKSTVEPGVGSKRRIALYGDSQVEGIAVDDQSKLFAAIERASKDELTVYPLAQSGDAMGEWLVQMPWAESELGVDEHWFLIVDIEDLMDLSPPVPPSGGRLRGLTAKVPAFLVVAARHLLHDSMDQPRRLRFGLGRQPSPKIDPPASAEAPSPENQIVAIPLAVHESAAGSVSSVEEDWEAVFNRIDQITDLPVTVIHAPMRPVIIGGRLVETPRYAESIARARKAAASAGVRWLSMGEALAESASRGVWPHGFHNGQMATGHLNADGYRVIAETVVEISGPR